MRKGKFTESQIVATLKQVESSRQVKDVCQALRTCAPSDCSMRLERLSPLGLMASAVGASRIKRKEGIEADFTGSPYALQMLFGLAQRSRTGLRSRSYAGKAAYRLQRVQIVRPLLHDFPALR